MSKADSPPASESERCAQWPVEVHPVFGCWMWQGKRDSGYGIIWIAGKAYKAHRHVYETLVGSIPSDKVLDHLCRRRLCVNPAHLEPVTPSENQKRKIWRYRLRAMKRCPSGHSLEGGIRTPEAGIVCRECLRVQ